MSGNAQEQGTPLNDPENEAGSRPDSPTAAADALPPKVKKELQGLQELWTESLSKFRAPFYSCSAAFLEQILETVRYGSQRKSRSRRRKKAEAVHTVAPDELLEALHTWAEKIKALPSLEPVRRPAASFIQQLPLYIYEEQAPARFILQDSDTGRHRAAKSAKAVVYKVQKATYSRLSDIISGLKPPKWKQRIPLKMLVEKNYAELLDPMLEERLRHIAFSEAVICACQEYIDGFLKQALAGIRREETPADAHSPAELLSDALQQLLSRISREEEAEQERINQYVDAQIQTVYRQCGQVDTIELSARVFSRATVQEKQKQTEEAHRRHAIVMSENIWLHVNELRLCNELLSLSNTGIKSIRETETKLKELFKGEAGFKALFELALEDCAQAAETFSIPPEARRSDGRLITCIGRLREAFQRLLLPMNEREAPSDKHTDEFAQALAELPDYAARVASVQPPASLIDEFSSTVLFSCNELREQLSYHAEQKAAQPKQLPSTKAEYINLREEVTAYLRGVMLRNLAPLSGKIEQECNALQEGWKETGEIISINLGSAIDVVEDREEEKYRVKASELAKESVQRGQERLRELAEEADKAFKTVLEDFDKAAGENIAFLLQTGLDGSYSNLKWKSRSVRAEATALGWKSKAVMYWSRFRDTAAVLRRFSGQKYRSSAEWVRDTTGIGAGGDEAAIQTNAAQFLAETDRIIIRLPLIYRRLYRNEPVEHKRFLIGRSSHLSALRQAYESWQTGYYSNFIAIGERGSGKTSVLDVGLQQLPLPGKMTVIKGRLTHTICTEEELVIHLCPLFGYEETLDTAGLISSLKQRKDKIVIVWEGFQNLYLRHIGGFKALEAFLLIISQTGQQVFWIISCSRYAWTYLDKIFRVGEYFVTKTFTDELSAGEIREIIMGRHPISGYELEFIAGEREQSSRSYKKLLNDFAKRQEYLANQYFTELYQIAEGNISIALLYWLRSVRTEDDITIKIAPLSESVRHIGEGLSEDALFALAFILLHDDLTKAQLAITLHIPEQESQLLLSRLGAKSLLSVGENGRYHLNQMLYRHITRILKTKNILH